MSKIQKAQEAEEKKERRSFGQVLLRGRIWYIRYRRKGRDIFRAVGPSKAMAEAKLAQIQTALLKREKLGVVETRRITFEKFWPTLEPILAARLAPKAYASDKNRYEVLQEFFGDRPICELEASDIEDFRTWMRSKRLHKGKHARPSTVNRYFAVLSNTFKEAMERGYAHENPVRAVKRAREEQKEVPFLTAADIDRIIDAADARLRPLIAVAADTGLRRGELLSLEWRDVQLGRGVVVVRKSKSKRPREVPMTQRARETLKALRGERTGPEEGNPDFVFAHIANLEPTWAATFVASRFRKAATAAGFPTVTFHGLRHAFCSRLAQSGVPLPTVKALAGHGSLALTSRYASHVPDNAEVAAVRALDSTDDAARKAADEGLNAPAKG
ncbi:MAG: tyrosine-type recombinase/integrase [Planctomycetes bacterium]|nr:tyrosine-type recombinase/integrase [Planctomycetota bacterium]